MTETRRDICIIGAGIIGTTIARRLSRYQLNITLIEKADDVAMGATKANSAIVHGGYAESNSKLKRTFPNCRNWKPMAERMV